MDPTHDPSPGHCEGLPSGGELVVQNGRLGGTPRSLGMPLTFLGRAAGCDVRLNVDGINALHCLIAHGPTGVVVRDLDSKHGTYVNGKRVRVSPLHHGDHLTVGPFEFVVQLPPAPAAPLATQPTEPTEAKPAADDPCRGDKDALRIQAAAVAAQQAALGDEEARLLQRHGALEQQEGQLATHLDDKRKRLLQLAEHAQASRTALQKEREAYEKHVEKVTTDLSASQRDLLEAQQKTQKERDRLINLRRRLKQRYHRHWLGERQVMRRREEAVAAQRRQLEKDADRLRQERTALAQTQLRINGEAELGRRRLQDERETLRAERQAHTEQCTRDDAERKKRAAALAEGEAALADGERLLEDEKYRWERACGFLKQETAGLETRIHNQRRKIVEQQQEIDYLGSRLGALHAAVPVTIVPAPVAPIALPEGAPAAESPPDSAAESLLSGQAVPPHLVPVVVVVEAAPLAAPKVDSPVPPEAEDALAARASRLCEAEQGLQRRATLLLCLAEELADQRLHLVELWQRLALTHHHWHQDRLSAISAVEALAVGWPAKEEELTARVRALEYAESELRQRHREGVHLQQHVEAWAARVRVRETSWESERDRFVVDVRGREQLAEKQLAALLELRQRWKKRRRQELDVIRAERAACEKLRQECATLREELWRHGTALEEERRLVAEKTLVLEQYRQQYVVRSEDAVAAERRVERLQRRWTTQNAEAIRATVAEREALRADIARLEDRHSALHKQMEALTVREANLAQRQTAWEETQALAESRQDKLQQELQSMQAQRDRYALHLLELQDEVERVARVLIEEPDMPLLPSPQAA